MSISKKLGILSEADKAFVTDFETGRIGPGSFHHSDHVRLAWAYLCRYSVEEALTRFSRALKNFAAAAGHPEKYHETITWAYILLINERMRRRPAGTWPAFENANPDLLDYENSILRRYYSAETLRSSLAKEVFLMPDFQSPA